MTNSFESNMQSLHVKQVLALGSRARCDRESGRRHTAARLPALLCRLVLAWLASMLIAQIAWAQTEPSETVAPIELWRDTYYSGYPSAGSLLAAKNAVQESSFAKCGRPSPPTTWTCEKLVFPSANPDPDYPTMRNGGYSNYRVYDSYWYYESANSKGEITTWTRDDVSRPIYRDLSCPPGFSARSTLIGPDNYSVVCVKTARAPLICPDRCSNSAPSGAPPSVGNPVQVYRGTKNEVQIDYASADGLLQVRREFLGQHRGWRLPGDSSAVDLHSQEQAPSAVLKRVTLVGFEDGAGVRRNELRKFSYVRSTGTPEFRIIHANGVHSVFRQQADGSFTSGMGADRVMRLSAPTAEGALWRRHRSDNAIEEFDTQGRLRKTQARSGASVTYIYDSNGRLAEMRDSWNRKLVFAYNPDGKVAQIALPDGLLLQYEYQDGLLSRVIYPDGKDRQFLYHEAGLVDETDPAIFALTGQVDENGARIGTYQYDAADRVIATESADGINKYSLYFGDGYTDVTSPLNAVSRYDFTTVAGREALSSHRHPAPAGAGIGAAVWQYWTYDASGNVTSWKNFKGIKTCYAYDLNRNLETARVEGLTAGADCVAALSAATLAPPVRKVTTQWRADYRLPVTIAEPLRITTNTHDASGNLLTKTVQATLDATGAQGLSAAVTGTPRTWTYTYNQYGQVLTARGPRTDGNDTTTYDYDAATGNLLTVTNAAGHVTTLSHYDANGRVGRIVDANGLTTDLAYWPRGWLKSRQVSGNGISEATTYDYDGVGQLTKVTLPDGSWIGYDYDNAHRLTDTYDSAGNRITYTLDAMGNRLSEEVRDPTGTLARQTTRIYDALSRVQQITGGNQ